MLEQEIFNLKVGDKISYKGESVIETINTVEIKSSYPEEYGENDKCITINEKDWYFDEIVLRN